MTFEDLFFGRQTQRAQIGTGSGVIISPDGYIITNNHVIDGSRALSVTLNNNKTYDAKIIGTDDKTDIALIKVEADEELPFTIFGDSDQAKIGEWVLAVGNPFNLTSTVTAGIISAKSRDLSGFNNQSFIQTDAAVNPGNSGGALVNTNGDLIGINTAISSQTGSYIGYSFAVPSNIAKKVVQDIMEYGNVQNGILGVRGGSVSSGYAEKFDLNTTEGFYIDEVEEDSGADMAGLKTGDIIQQMDHVKIKKFSDLRGFLNSKSPKDIVNLTILRNGIEKEIPVTLLKNETFAIPIIGTIKNAKPNHLRKYNTLNGVKISRLTSNRKYLEFWNNNGVQEGDVITAINNVKINNVEDVQSVLKNIHTNELLRIELINSKGEKERYNFR
ncbi:UNVERIFIED_CONTAM: hypothetical protein GTU68_054100 [Idotea baltica]|nr:hypothetical protein [Idotea baltica]